MTIKELQEELKKVEPRIDFLHEVCGCGLFTSITQTSDGFFLGQRPGDIGYNVFLGKPSSNAMARTRQFLQQLSEPAQKLACRLLARFELVGFDTAV